LAAPFSSITPGSHHVRSGAAAAVAEREAPAPAVILGYSVFALASQAVDYQEPTEDNLSPTSNCCRSIPCDERSAYPDVLYDARAYVSSPWTEPRVSSAYLGRISFAADKSRCAVRILATYSDEAEISRCRICPRRSTFGAHGSRTRCWDC
jgi:hypothetical protein